MMKSLFAGAVALALIAVAALAEEAYSGDATARIIPSAPATSTPATSTPAARTPASVSLASSVDPRVFDPTQIVTYHARRSATQGGQPTEKPAATSTTRIVTQPQE